MVKERMIVVVSLMLELFMKIKITTAHHPPPFRRGGWTVCEDAGGKQGDLCDLQGGEVEGVPEGGG